MKDILLVIDMQNDFISGALGTPEAQAIVPAVKAKIDEYCKTGEYNKIYYTRDNHFDKDHEFDDPEIIIDYRHYEDTIEGKHLLVPHCLYKSEGWEIPEELTPMEEPNILDKLNFGTVDWSLFTPFVDYCKYLKEIKAGTEDPYINIEICGLCTDICVISNAIILKGMMPEDAEIFVDPKCCAGTTPEAHEAAIKVMRSCQINIIE